MQQKTVCEFEIKDMFPIGMVFVVFGIGITYGLNVLSDVKDEMVLDCGSGTYNTSSDTCMHGNNSRNFITAERNASEDSILGVAKLPEKLPLIATVIVAAIIIGILIRYLMLRFT